MKVLKSSNVSTYDLAVVGLGYESRAITTCDKFQAQIENVVVLGYQEHNDVFSYKKNLDFYHSLNADIIEESDLSIFKSLREKIKKSWSDRPISCLLDITVMSRTRLATVLMILMENLHKDSTVRICYELAEFTQPLDEISPIRKVGPIIESLSGSLGDINLPSSIVIGLGYEFGKAIGISNYLDAEKQFVLVPKSKDERFDIAIKNNNKLLLESTPKEHVFDYDVSSPYKSYLNLRELIIAITEISRPIIVPLGPKILSALFVILSKEMDYALPVWRVSSEHHEKPVDRKSSGNMFELNLLL